MQLKLYRSATVAAAMSRIRRELGPNALILHTRRVSDGVEVAAALEQDDDEALPLYQAAPVPQPAVSVALTYHNVPADLAAPLAQGDLPSALAKAFRFRPLALAPDSAPLLLAGPPGAGKTLTAARLATQLVIAGTPPRVITADGQRAGGAEQLAAFTRLLGISLITVEGVAALGKAIRQCEPGRPTIVDLPGSNPFCAEECDELEALAECAAGSLVAVLPAGLDPAEAQELAEGYRIAGARQLVATRLDLARRLGAVLAAGRSGLALAAAGIGPGAADGLVDMTPDFLAQRLMSIPLLQRAR